MPSAASLVPNFDVTVYIVFDDFGEAGWIYREAEEASLESVIADLLTGQFKNPARVVAFNTSEGWSRDVSETVAREVFRRVAELGLSLAINSREFVETYVEQNELLHAGKSPHKLAKGYDLDKVAAVHEAGHAVARYLCADAMGFSFVEAVGYIEIAPPFSRPWRHAVLRWRACDARGDSRLAHNRPHGCLVKAGPAADWVRRTRRTMPGGG